MPDISITYLGLKLDSPLIAASSGMTRDIARLHRCREAGFGAAVMKSLFEDETSRVDPAPCYSLIKRGDASVFYSFEQASDWGPERYAEEIQRANTELEIPVIPSINCITRDGWRDYAKRMQDAGAPAIELNVSCPYGSVTANGDIAESVIYRAVEAVLDAVSIPVAVKLPGRLTSIELVVTELEFMGVRGVVMFNRFAGLDIDIENERPIMHGGAAGHGGAFAFHFPMLWVSRISPATGMDVAASGGTTSAADVIKYLLAGAGAVQVCTAIYMNGYEVAGKFIAGLKAWMDLKGYPNVAAFRGKVSGGSVLGSSEIVRGQKIPHHIDVELCISCDICRQRCPHESISNEDGVYKIIPATCVSCGFCVQVCPVGAVRRGDDGGSEV